MSNRQDSMMDEYEAERVYGPPPRASKKDVESEEGRIDFLELPTLREAFAGLSIVAVCLLVPTWLGWRYIRRSR